MAGGKRFDCADIHGVLTLPPCVFAEELENIRPDDRDYVASELNAFLLAWRSP